MPESLLPPDSTPYEKALEEAFDVNAVFSGAIESIASFKVDRPLPEGFGPFIVWENGLGPISKFFATSEEILDNGLPWLNLRETPAGVTTALSWIGYTSPSLEDQNIGRRKWNRYQINMGQLPPDNEVETLNDAEYLADLSDGARDVPFRGFHGYDIRELVTGVGKIGHHLIGGASGVRVSGGKTLWSHGEEFAVSEVSVSADKILLGVNYTQGQELTWEDDISWDAPGITWEGVQDVPAFKSWTVLQRPTYIAFWDADDELIGLRRVGNWKSELAPVDDYSVLKFTVRTGFGNGAGKAAASCGLIFHASNIDALKQGKQWLEADEVYLSDDLTMSEATIAKTPINILFKETVRVLVEFTLTI